MAMRTKDVDTGTVKRLLDKKQAKYKRYLSHCAHCSICAESCFLYQKNDKDPVYMPSYKAIRSLGVMYKKKGKLTRADLEEIKTLVWKKCVLCKRCYCPIGVDIHGMIGYAREICRTQGVFPTERYPEPGEDAESWL